MRSLSVIRTVTITIVIWLAVVCTLFGTTYYSGYVMDRVALENQRELVNNAISSRLSQGLSEMRSIAWWNDMVTHTDSATFDASWLDLEVGSYMVETFSHKRIYVLSEANKPIYVYGDNVTLKSPVVSSDMRAFEPLIKQARGGPNVSPRVEPVGRHTKIYEYIGTSDRKFSRAFGSVVNIGEQPALAMAMLITPTIDVENSPPTRRLVLSIIVIDNAVLNRFGRDTLMRDLSFRHEADQRLGTFRLQTDSGHPLVTLSWTPRRPGTAMVARILPWLFSALVIATAFFITLMIRLFASTRQLAAREADARFLADHDVLTGLPNRRRLESLFLAHFGDPQPMRHKIAVACVDLDRFKDINDTLGHNAGDELIKAVATRLQSKLRLDDTLARLGGDEFAIMRPVFGDKDVNNLSDMIADCFSESFAVMGHLIEANASTGLAFATCDNSFGDTIKRADIALYDAKANGRGRMSQFTTAMADEIEHRHAIQVDLKRALSARELTLNYQPVVEATSGAVTSVEALLRWNSPTHGFVPPDLFVSIAEEVGLMAELGRFVIEQAIEDAQRWPELTTAINISPAQLRSATIISDLLEPAKRFGVSPSRLTIEITESVLMSSDDRTLRVLNELKRHGFTLALDDFGTGYSSLAYIRDFPFDKLKIDRSFVQGLSESARALAIVEGVVKFGKILGREIVAEGIETEEEMAAMQKAGATHLQGFLFSRALPAEHIEAIAATFGPAAMAPDRVAKAPARQARPRHGLSRKSVA